MSNISDRVIAAWDGRPARGLGVGLGAAVPGLQAGPGVEGVGELRYGACDVVSCITPGAAVVVDAGDLRPGLHLNMLGADGPGEAEPFVGAVASCRLFCDEWRRPPTAASLQTFAGLCSLWSACLTDLLSRSPQTLTRHDLAASPPRDDPHAPAGTSLDRAVQAHFFLASCDDAPAGIPAWRETFCCSHPGLGFLQDVAIHPVTSCQLAADLVVGCHD